MNICRLYLKAGTVSKTTHGMASRRGLEIIIEDEDINGTRQRVLDIADASGESDFSVAYAIPTTVAEFSNGDPVAHLHTTTLRGVPSSIDVGDERELRLLIKVLGERIAT